MGKDVKDGKNLEMSEGVVEYDEPPKVAVAGECAIPLFAHLNATAPDMDKYDRAQVLAHYRGVDKTPAEWARELKIYFEGVSK